MTRTALPWAALAALLALVACSGGGGSSDAPPPRSKTEGTWIIGAVVERDGSPTVGDPHFNRVVIGPDGIESVWQFLPISPEVLMECCYSRGKITRMDAGQNENASWVSWEWEAGLEWSRWSIVVAAGDGETGELSVTTAWHRRPLGGFIRYALLRQ